MVSICAVENRLCGLCLYWSCFLCLPPDKAKSRTRNRIPGSNGTAIADGPRSFPCGVYATETEAPRQAAALVGHT